METKGLRAPGEAEAVSRQREARDAPRRRTPQRPAARRVGGAGGGGGKLPRFLLKAPARFLLEALAPVARVNWKV